MGEKVYGHMSPVLLVFRDCESLLRGESLRGSPWRVGWKWRGDEVSIQGLSWSGRAAAEAELAAARECSGHGRAYLDGVVVDGRPACECNTCYGGPECSLFLPSCSADADDGDPLFLEPFWKQHAESSAVVVAGWHRMSYSFSDQTTLSKELESLLRKLHSLVGNAITDGKYILFGVGSTQLSAAVHALSPLNSSLPASVVASIPYYALYQMQTELFDSADCSFQGDPVRWKNVTNTTGDIIEFVTAPNNPDGQLNEAILHGPNVKTIHDRAYYWPHFTGIPSPADEDLTIFTISKLTGHAGSRFKAYARVKCEREEDRNCIEILNAAKILGRGGSIFHDDNRYTRLSLIRSDDNFDMLISRLESLVSGEDGAKIM
ncbi:tryptophan aminotransferase-related protein 4-like [Eucalyptus grandis]|uniref:tryptophan aminotransferase-related protein 4-like n=1 Tax=Eucalyptus grandis TaxID=71139 RepID=UPI00192EB179|nr:tryptophan aminotransferase-related protein 4-like [Eucalyptus grandis]